MRAETTQKKKELAAVGRENIVLHQRFKDVSDAKEELQQKYHDMVGQLKSLDRIKGQMEAFRMQVSTLTAKVTENNKRTEMLQNELEASKQQVCLNSLHTVFIYTSL